MLPKKVASDNFLGTLVVAILERVVPGPKSSHWFFGSLSMRGGATMATTQSHSFRGSRSSTGRTVMELRIMIADPEALKHVFTTNGENFPRAELSRSFPRVSPFDHHDADELTEGEEHTHQRKMLVPHFGFGKIKEFIDVFATHAAELCIKLKELADQPNVTVDMPAYFTELTLDIIDVSAFGYNFKAMSGSSPVVDAMKLLLSPRSAFYLVGKAVISTFSSWPLPRLVNERKAKKMLHQTVDDVIAAKLKSKRDVNRPVDLVDLMLDENAHAEHKVTAEEARTHVMTFMLAGHEHPHIEALAREEARAVTANGGTIGWNTLGDMKYITACIQEALRLYPTVAALAPRVAELDDYLPRSDGKPIFIPKAGRHICRNELSEPTKPCAMVKGNTYYSMPFSVGAKNCIGMRFAMAELQVVVATLLLRFSSRLTDQANVNPKMVGVSIKPVHLDMTVHSIA
ncbi:unnamed protein product [Aphanomyces euteiches]